MQILLIILFVIVASIAFYFFEEKSNKKRARLLFQKSYGQKPKRNSFDSDNLNEIALYYNLIKQKIPQDEIVDDITWDDLEMDKVFSRINSTVSYVGEQFLYSELHNTPKDKKKLHLRERGIQFFHNNPEKRLEAQCLLRKLPKESLNFYIPECIHLLDSNTIPFIKVYKLLFYSLICFLIGGIITQNTWILYAAGINFFINIGIYALNKLEYELYMESLYGIIATVKVAKSLSHVCPNDVMLPPSSMKSLDKISRMVVLLKQKKQIGFSGDILGLLTDYIIGAFMWDFTIYDKVTHLLGDKKEDFFSLYEFVGEIDLCIAIASFRQSLEHYCTPQFHPTIFDGKDIYHPLIEGAVTNDFHMEKGVILTGSNASGKSTFIKAIAINMILGQTIHTCTARTIQLPNAKVLTSMSVRDNISSGESYYMKEIKYLYRIIKESKEERFVFCGIDEILRGTNTAERIAASIAILHYLRNANCLPIIATHDLELAKTLDGLYNNYYFCESIQNGDVVFDYQLRQGICSSYNAIRLLESIGFPQEIIKEAKQQCRL